MRTPSRLIVWLALTGLVLVGAIQKPSDATLKAEWTAFVKDFDKAQQDWLKPYREAKTDEEREKALDMSKNPAKEYVPRAIAFAERAKGTEWAASAWYWVFSNAQNEVVRQRSLSTLLKDHIKSDKMLTIAGLLQYDGYGGSRQEAIKSLEVLSKSSPHKEVRAQALYSLAMRQRSLESDSDKGRQLVEKRLNELMKKYPDSKAAKSAAGAIYEIKNLQVGQVAPDFVAEDENGVKFKLSDYRGRVVILDFWGFW